MYSHSYSPDNPYLHYPYHIHTDVPLQDSPDSYSSLSPQTPATQYSATAIPYTVSTTSTTPPIPLWSSWDPAYDYHQQPEAHTHPSSYSPQSHPTTYHHVARNGCLSPHYAHAQLAPPPASNVARVTTYSEVQQGEPGMTSAATVPRVFSYDAADRPPYTLEQAEAEERPPRYDVFDEPLRREHYVQRDQTDYGGDLPPDMHHTHGNVDQGRASFDERQHQSYRHDASAYQQQVCEQQRQRQQAYTVDQQQQQAVYTVESQYSGQQHVYRHPYEQNAYTDHHQPPSQSSRKVYPIHPQVCREQEWAAAQIYGANSLPVVPIHQREGEPPMEALRPEREQGQTHEQEKGTTLYSQAVSTPAVMNMYSQVPEQKWPQPPGDLSPASAPVPVSTSSSLSNAITTPLQNVKGDAPHQESTPVPTAKRSPSPPALLKPATPVPIVPSQSHLAPPPQILNTPPQDVKPNSKDTTTTITSPPHTKAAQSPTPSIPPPRLPRNPRREQPSFRPFHPYPTHRHHSSTSPTSPISPSNPSTSNDVSTSNTNICPASTSGPITPVFGLFGSYPLALPEGSDTPLPGPTCAPETSSSVMRLVLTPALKKNHQGMLGVGGAGVAMGGLGDGSAIVPPVVRRPRMACFFCRKRKIACGPGPGMAGEGSGGKDGSVSPGGSPISEGGGGEGMMSASAGVSTVGGKVNQNQSQEDDGPCNQCARRGLRCERPTESRRGVRKTRKITLDGVVGGDGMNVDNAAGVVEGAVLLELVPRKKGSWGKKGRTEVGDADADETMGNLEGERGRGEEGDGDVEMRVGSGRGYEDA